VDVKSLSRDHPAQELIKEASSSHKSSHEKDKKREHKSSKSQKQHSPHKKQKTSQHNSSKHRSPSPKKEKEKESWLRSNIMVKINSKTFANAKYFNKKVMVVDVVKRGECTVQLDNGKLLEGIKQDMVETVVPAEGEKVIVVCGKHKGKIGVLMAKDRSTEIVFVQFDDDDVDLPAEKLSMDDISQIVGEIEN